MVIIVSMCKLNSFLCQNFKETPLLCVNFSDLPFLFLANWWHDFLGFFFFFFGNTCQCPSEQDSDIGV
jgi:hypothetical protein